MMSRISQWILQLFGWKIIGDFPADQNKFLVIVAPHTSNWDFLLGLLVRSTLKEKRVKFIGKKSLFRFPYGFIFRALGGYPVDRKKSSGFVDSIIQIYNREEVFATTITPEGTRSKVDKLKTGFYYIAKGANVPLVLVQFDYANKIVRFREPLHVSGDFEADMEIINNYFRGIQGKHPEKSYLFEG